MRLFKRMGILKGDYAEIARDLKQSRDQKKEMDKQQAEIKNEMMDSRRVAKLLNVIQEGNVKRADIQKKVILWEELRKILFKVLPI